MRTSFFVALLVILSFLLGFARDVLIARQFGSGWQADALFVALMLPVFFENLLGLALRDAMIPYLQRLRTEAPGALVATVRRFYAGSWMAGLLMSALVGIGAPLWLHALAPGWTSAQLALGIAPFCVGAALIAVQTVLYCQTAVLNIEGRFVLPMWRTVLFNIGGIAAILVYPDSASSILWGMLAGQTALLVVQHGAIRWRCTVAPGLTSRVPNRFLREFMPVLLATAAQQACVLAERLFASLLEEGSITQLSFAFRIATIPLTLLALSILAILYPGFAASWAEQVRSTFVALLRKAVGMTLVFLVPAAVVLAVQPVAVVATLLERGQFGAAQTAATAPLLAAYAIGLPGMGLALLGGRVLLAQRRARAFLGISLAGAVLTIALDALLYRPWGARGLAAACTVGSWAQVLVYAVLIGRRTPASLELTVALRWAAAASAASWLLSSLPVPGGFPGLIGAYALALLAHLALLGLLGERELFRRDFWRLRSPAAGAGVV